MPFFVKVPKNKGTLETQGIYIYIYIYIQTYAYGYIDVWMD